MEKSTKCVYRFAFRESLLTAGQITHSIAFCALLVLISQVVSLPLSLYQTFVLEERHGFNKTTPGLFVTDLLKGWAIGFVIGAPFLAAFLRIFEWAGDRFVPWLMAFLYVDCLIGIAFELTPYL